MTFDIFGQLIRYSCFLQAHRTLGSVKVLHIDVLVLFLILIKDARKSAMLLKELFLTVGKLSALQIMHDIEVFS